MVEADVAMRLKNWLERRMIGQQPVSFIKGIVSISVLLNSYEALPVAHYLVPAQEMRFRLLGIYFS